MTFDWPMHRSRFLALAAANLAAAWFVISPWLPETTRHQRIAAASAATDAPTLASLPPLAMFTATAERPLFSPSRRPSATAAPGTGALEGRYRLLGLVIAGKARRALIADIAGGRRLDLGEGEALDGWMVKRIDRDAVVFASPAGETTLTLRNGVAVPSAKP